MNDESKSPGAGAAERCPSAAELAAWDAGRLDDNETERIAAHLETCSSCRSMNAVPESDEAAISWALMQSPASAHDEPDLARALSRLLAEPEAIDAAQLPDEALAGWGAVFDAPPSFPERVGAYALVRPLGRGAMGWVYEAEHVNLHRRMALKLLPPTAVDDAANVARFYQEMASIGKLSHPHIVQAYDAGEADGHHYLAMELVTGCDASRLVKRFGPLRIADACELARQVALALKYAHAHNLVHRDVKPSNVMVSLGGQVKLLDLGLATIRVQRDAHITQAPIAGTAEYMAPEQWTPGTTVDGRADLYALGCTLFKLLTGATPFAATATYAGLAEAHRKATAPSLRATRRDVPEELAALVARLLAKSPEDRPTSADEVARVLATFANGANLRSLVASAVIVDADADTLPPSQTWTMAPAQATRVSPKRRWLTAAGALFAATIALALLFYKLTDRAELVLQIEPVGATISVDAPGNRVTSTEATTSLSLGSGSHTIVIEKDGFEERIVRPELKRGDRQELKIALKPRELIVAPTAQWRVDEEGSEALAISPDGEFAMISSASGVMRLWRIETQEMVREFKGHDLAVHAIVFSKDGKRAASAGEDNIARFWDVQTGNEIARFFHPKGHVLGVALSPDGKLLATASYDFTLRVWDIATTECLWTGTTHSTWVRFVYFSPDGTRLLSGGNDTLSLVWDVKTGRMQRALVGQSGPVLTGQFSADGKLTLTGGYDRRAMLWNVDLEIAERDYVGHAEGVVATFTSDNRHIVTASRDGEMRYWSIEHSQCLARFVNPGVRVDRVACMPDGKSALSLGSDGMVCVWQLPEEDTLAPHMREYLQSEIPLQPPPPDMSVIEPARSWQASQQAIHAMAFSPDGAKLLTAGDDGAVRQWNTETGELVRHVDGGGEPLLCVGFSWDGAKFAAGGKDSAVRVWDAPTGNLQSTYWWHKNWVSGLSFMQNGPWLATGSADGDIHVWNHLTDETLYTIDAGNMWVRSVRFSPHASSSYALTTGFDASMVLWEIGSGAAAATFEPKHRHIFCDARYSPDARLGAAVGWSGRIEIWDLIEKEPVRTIEVNAGGMASVSFGADAHHIAAACADSTVRLWNVDTGQEIARFLGPTQPILALETSRDGHLLAGAGREGKVFLWPLPPAQPVTPTSAPTP